MLLCGFAILFPTQITNLDSLTRRWTDVVWVGVRRPASGREVKDQAASTICYWALYCVWGLVALRLTPGSAAPSRDSASGVFLNFGIRGFSSLPRPCG